jgi:hypothetical protein
MITGYVYNADTMELIAEITGEQIAIEDYVNTNYDLDEYGLTYSPAFGCNDGLVDNGDAETINLDND